MRRGNASCGCAFNNIDAAGAQAGSRNFLNDQARRREAERARKQRVFISPTRQDYKRETDSRKRSQMKYPRSVQYVRRRKKETPRHQWMNNVFSVAKCPNGWHILLRGLFQRALRSGRPGAVLS